jgi:hypothetical protein
MKSRMILPLLLVSAALAAPASAAGNWFHNPYENINRNIGSAPNPTPQDLREMRLPLAVENEKNTTTADAATVWDRMFARTASTAPAQPAGGTAQPAPASPSR